jgi:hypothetical protein
MHAVRGITTPPIATTSDGISATTQNIIAFLSLIDGPVYESLTLPPAKEFKGETSFPRGSVRLSFDNNDHTQSGATRGKRRQKQRQIQQLHNEDNRGSTPVVSQCEILPTCRGGPVRYDHSTVRRSVSRRLASSTVQLRTHVIQLIGQLTHAGARTSIGRLVLLLSEC